MSSLVDDLAGARRHGGQIGRPASALTLNRAGFVGVGLEINVDYIAVCVGDLVGEVRSLRMRPRDNRGQSPAKVLARAMRMTCTAVASAEAAGLTVAGLAVAVPGLVEADAGLLRLAPNLGWVDVFVHVSGEIGVGGGIVVGGELFRGVLGFADEIGHVTVEPDGPRCRCGARGCLETVAGQEAILRAAGLTGAVGTSIGQPGGSVAERAIAHPWSPARVLASRLGPDAAVRGAAGSVVKRVLSDPVAVFGAPGHRVAPTRP